MAVGKDGKVITGRKGQGAFESKSTLGRSIGNKFAKSRYSSEPYVKPEYEILEFTVEDVKRGIAEAWRENQQVSDEPIQHIVSE
jgi:hypothetical protein